MKNTKFYQSILIAIKASKIKRNTGYSKAHKENDAEHSFQLALVAWETNHQYNLNLNLEKILKYALVHDLVEVYAGDIDAHASKKLLNTKEQKEKKALEKLKKTFTQLSEIFDTIEEYERKDQPESQLVYLLDKFIPDFHIFLAKDSYYHDRNIDKQKWQQWLTSKLKKIELDPKLEPLCKDISDHILSNLTPIFAHPQK